jgi:ferrochelatase
MLNSTRRLGVVLFQLGGPDTPEAIEPFLFNLFSDPDIIDFPGARIARKPLARLISATRARKVQRHYASLGGASPIRRFTEDQAHALESKLRNSGIDAHCFVAMRYWHPFTVEAVEQLRTSRCDGVVLLPLYPHYSSTTTGSSLNEWRRLFHDDIPVHVVEPFYNHSLFLQAIVEKVNEVLAQMTAPDRADIVFSAHSVPLYVIERGDPYRSQIEHCVELVMSLGGWRNRHRICYQSKVGAARWLQPSLHQTLKTIAAESVREVCVVPISFVSDHVETLGELHHEARLEAAHPGIERFEVTSGLNSSPKFIDALAELVQNALKPASSEAKRLEDGMLTAAD